MASWIEVPDFQDLSEEQKKVYEYGLNKNLLIDGAAGSGKTILAILRARQLEKLGKKVLFLVFNNVLQSFTRYAVKQYGLTSTKVHTIQDLTYDTLGFRVMKPDTLKTNQIHKLTNSYNFDHVIIDEGQDFNNDTYRNIYSKLGSVFTICMDTRQSIFDVDFDENQLYQIFSDLEKKNLEFTYRNPIKILALSLGFYKKLYQTLPFSTNIKGFNPQPGEIDLYSTDNEIELIAKLVNNRGNNTLGILLPRKDLVTLFLARLKENGCSGIEEYYSGINPDVLSFSFSNEKPKLLPYWSAKGIQFDIVIIPFLDESYRGHVKNELFNKTWEKEWKALYVSMTRARSKLVFTKTMNHSFPYLDYLNEDLMVNKGLNIPTSQPDVSIGGKPLEGLDF